MAKKPLIIAIDGPAASGKGTLAKNLAAYLSLPHLDTGKIYRAVGYQMLQDGNALENEALALKTAQTLKAEALDSADLYDEGVGHAASVISAMPAVREALMQFQKAFANQSSGAVLDGRDIGTVICPNASAKFFITADIETRARRRYKQLHNEDNSVIYEAVLQDLQRRDDRDSKRQIAPLKQADDAIALDTTTMSAEDVLAYVIGYLRDKHLTSL